jgi:molybdate transport system substrate-binding protein
VSRSAAGDGSIAVGDVRQVLVGEYAKAALEKLGAWQGAAPKLWMAPNTRVALTMVARGFEPGTAVEYRTQQHSDGVEDEILVAARTTLRRTL